MNFGFYICELVLVSLLISETIGFGVFKTSTILNRWRMGAVHQTITSIFILMGIIGCYSFLFNLGMGTL